jgi:hypothetical protein
MEQWNSVRDNGSNIFQSDLEVGTVLKRRLCGRAEYDGTAVVKRRLAQRGQRRLAAI